MHDDISAAGRDPPYRLGGQIGQWLDHGQPDEARIRRARAREVVVVGYSGRAVDLWWDKNAGALARLDDLSVIDVSAAADQLAPLLARNLDVQCLIQDGEAQWITAAGTVVMTPGRRKAAQGRD